MDYRDALGRLVSARRFGMKLGLERMRALLDALDAPDRHLGTVIHVAGTNGKGSTVAMLAALVASGGARVATYTSPHLTTIRERIVIDGVMVSEEQFVGAYERVAAAGGAELTFFEQITAIGILLIAERRPDVTIVEVGLGGRLDATNVIAANIAVITGVAMDHEAILGTTLDAIAFEKAGICKPGQAVVVGACGEPEGVPLLVAHARATGCQEPLVVAADTIVPELGLLGPHQRLNAALALAVVATLGLPHDPAALADVQHPGRFELLVSHRVILDGAHNPHGARALAVTLRERGFQPVLVLAVSSDKDVRAIAEALLPEVSSVIATRYQQERAMDPEALADVLREVQPDLGVVSLTDLPTALMRARAKGQWTLIAGSLFIVGEARTLLLGAATDPVRATDPVSLQP